jgi:hypothetical protein
VHFYSDCSRVLLGKLLVTKLIKRRPDFYETQKMYCYVQKSLAQDCVQRQLNPIHTLTYASKILFSLCLGLPSVLDAFKNKHCALFSNSHARYIPRQSHSPFFVLLISGEEYKLWGFSNSFLTYLIRSSYTLRCRGCFFILIILQTVGLLVRVISSSQGLYLSTGQHKHRINTYT